MRSVNMELFCAIMSEVASELAGLYLSAAAAGWPMLGAKPPAKEAVNQLAAAWAYVSG